MAKFDFHRWRGGDGYLLDCQADLLSYFKTRLVIPLIKDNATPRSLVRLHPIFDIDGEPYLMATHLMSSVPASELGTIAGSLIDYDIAIMGAIDMLVSGY
ncbi:MAG: CcdB family protein [Sphingomonadaceae bacterium]